jgi:hypothetical protein
MQTNQNTTTSPLKEDRRPNLQTLVTWDAIEFEEHEKGPGWYLTLLIVAALLVFYDLFTKDYFGAILLIIIAVIIYFYSKVKPEEVHVQITDGGLLLNDAFIPYSNMMHFWFVEHQHSPMLHIELDAYLNRYLVIHLHDQDKEEIRKVLSTYIKETDLDQEPFLHRISRFLKL